jgi:riboflavin synthase
VLCPIALMFTGLVEAMGRVLSVTPAAPGARLRVGTPLGPLSVGESVSVNGACLTVTGVTPDAFDADLTSETLERTMLGRLSPGARVNLERAVLAGARLGGHLVSGHVDGRARVMAITPEGDARNVKLECPRELSRYVAEKGSVALDGVSLTVNAVSDNVFSLMLIPHTLAATTLGELTVGAELNLEVDLVARYVERLVSGGRS